jgi:acyl carrier protein
MTEQEILDRVLGALECVAPEIEDQPIDPAKFLRDQIEIDSMDFLNFVNALRTAFGIDIPEDAYPRLASIGGCVRFIKARLALAGIASRG